jgi:hypothetical protein
VVAAASPPAHPVVRLVRNASSTKRHAINPRESHHVEISEDQ